MSENETAVVQPAPRRSIRPNRPGIRRHHFVCYTDAEWAHLQEVARLCGMKPSVFIRETSLRRRVRVKPFLANAELIRELSKNGMALVHLAETARDGGALPVAGEVQAALAELRMLIRRIASSEAQSGARC